jgi:excisionase family DNA binding protein
MSPTDSLRAAAHQLGEAIVNLIVALDEAANEQRIGGHRERSVDSQSPSKRAAVTPSGPQLITAKEAAKRLAVSERHLYRMSAPHGPIPTIRIGASVRWSLEDVENALNQLKRSGSPR